MNSNCKRIGDYIRLVDERNKDLAVTTLLGLSINKEFIPSVANTIGSNMANYKIIRKGQFACSLMQVRRDKKIPVAILKDFDEAIISQAYPVFEVMDSEELLPEYLMMWMTRSEFDREACFYAIGGVRGSLEWEDFCDMKLPIPSIEKQREIVKEYNVIVDRIALNTRLNQKLEETAQAIYKHWFVDFEFPISKEYAQEIGKPEQEGKPYKSSGGELVYNDELDQEIPKGWLTGVFSDHAEIIMGQSPHGDTYNADGIGTPLINGPVEFGSYFTKKAKWTISPAKMCEPGDLIVCVRGSTTGKNVKSDGIYCLGRGVCSFRANKSQYFVDLLYKYNLIRLLNLTTGSTFPNLGRDVLHNFPVIVPKESIIHTFDNTISRILNVVHNVSIELNILVELSKYVVSKMTQITDDG